jgi:hypothetical protein
MTGGHDGPGAPGSWRLVAACGVRRVAACDTAYGGGVAATSRTNDGQMIKGLTAAIGDQALHLLLPS